MENVTGLQPLPAMPKIIVREHPFVVEEEQEDDTLVILPNGQVSPESFA